MNILMIVFHYPPLNEMASSRHFAFAKYWTRMGHHVTVITPKKYSYHGKLNYTPRDQQNIELIEVDYARWFTKRFEKENVTKDKESSLNGIRRIIRFLRKNVIGNAFDTQKLWKDAVYKRAAVLGEEREFDFLYSSFSPPVTFEIASLLKSKFPNLFWVADYRDLWSGNHLLKTNKMLAFFQERKEKRLLEDADMIITVSNGFKKYLQNFHTREVVVIFNGFDDEEIKSISKDRFFPKDNKLRFIYTGTIYIGTRNPAPFFKAVKRLESEGYISNENIEIWFFGDSANVLEIARGEGVEEYIRIGGRISKEDAYRAQRDADGILFLEKEYPAHNLSAQGTIPAKVFESLISGTEIFAIGISSNTFAGNLIEETGTGTAYSDNSNAIYEKLKKISTGKIEQNYSPNHKLIAEYSRDKSAEKLLSMMIENKGR